MHFGHGVIAFIKEIALTCDGTWKIGLHNRLKITTERGPIIPSKIVGRKFYMVESDGTFIETRKKSRTRRSSR